MQFQMTENYNNIYISDTTSTAIFRFHWRFVLLL